MTDLSQKPFKKLEDELAELCRRLAELQHVQTNNRQEKAALPNQGESFAWNAQLGYACCKMLFENNVPSDFIYLEVNEAFEKLTGLKEVVGRRVTEILPGIKTDHPEWLEIYGRVALSGRPEKLESYIESLKIWLSVSVYSSEKDIFVTLINNITESKQAEGALRLSNDYNRSLIEASLDPLVTIALNGQITDVNAATEAVTGLSRAELVGTDFSDYFTRPDLARAGYQQVFREGAVIDYPLEIRHRGGQVYSVLYNASVYRDSAGKVIGIFAAARDITERKRVEEALRLANDYNRSLIEASLDPLVTIGPNGQITDVNAATEWITGYRRTELVGTDFSDYFTRPDLARAGYQRVFREGVVHDYPLEIRSRDGRCYAVLYNASVYRDAAGEVIGVFAAARDITERRRAEEALQAAQAELEKRVLERTAELQAANDELETLVRTMAHDLRTPLRAMAGYSHLLDENEALQLDEESRHAVNRVKLGSKRMGQVIDGLMDYMQLRTQVVCRQKVDACSLAREVVSRLQSTLPPARQVYFTIGDLPPCRADPDLLQIVFANLLENAVKFTESCPEAQIEVGGQDGAYFVRDNGIGFDPQYAEKIFSIFERLHRADEFEGMGIGLAMAKRIIERHGGRIWAESQSGKGAVFYFTLE